MPHVYLFKGPVESNIEGENIRLKIKLNISFIFGGWGMAY
jgi:hypothetical protein